MSDFPIFGSDEPAEAPKAPEAPTLASAPAGSKGGSAPDLYAKIEGEQTFLGKIASKIPGFSGYIERSRRREADQLLRDTISARLEDVRLKLSSVHQDLSRDIILAIDHAEPLGRCDSRLMGLIGKIKDAPQGYSGFFDAVKVKEDDLARIYEFDASLMANAEVISANVDVLQSAVMSSGDIGAAIRILDTSIQDATTKFNSRNEVIFGVDS